MRAASVVLFCFAAARAETLRYSINWPSGFNLGEGELSAGVRNQSRAFSLRLDASLPGFPIQDTYSSTATESLCSQSFQKTSHHGGRKAAETLTFDLAANTVVRETKDGGRSQTQTAPCARDALTYLFHLREALKQNRLPAAETVYFGAPYKLRLETRGVATIANRPADRIDVTAIGPASEIGFELYFARDAARTLVSAKAPFAMGIFAMELLP